MLMVASEYRSVPHRLLIFSDIVEIGWVQRCYTYLGAEGGEESAIVCAEDVLLRNVCALTVASDRGWPPFVGVCMM